ncbi:hypothetical protein Q9L58_010649 [Maublancomyces gigas]|uniref:Integrase zinc-binding domain-containing protein n=1 Tax=Discina gigas TaxID=1032678 RepID=A0ABR3G3J1_9PEZI
MKYVPDTTSQGFAELNSNGNHHHYSHDTKTEEEELLILTASFTALRIQKFETVFVEKVKESAAMDEDYQETRKKVEEGTAEKRLKHYTASEGLLYWKKRLTIPDNDEIKTVILKNRHDSPVAGHFGIDKTVELCYGA